MHRQSLGSPASKLHSHGVLFTGVITTDIDKNIISGAGPTSVTTATDNEQHKSQKPRQHRHVLLVHLIPVLTFLCFLILYLSSHDPSRKELAQFTGFATISSKKTLIDAIDIDDNVEKNDAIVIRSMRNLQQQQDDRNRVHRKFGQ